MNVDRTRKPGSGAVTSATLAGQIIGASRAAVQRCLAWIGDHGLIREVTGQARFRMWGAVA